MKREHELATMMIYAGALNTMQETFDQPIQPIYGGAGISKKQKRKNKLVKQARKQNRKSK